MLTRVEQKKKRRRDDVASQRDVSHRTASSRLIRSSSTSDGKGAARERRQPHKVNYQRPFHLFNGSAVVWGTFSNVSAVKQERVKRGERSERVRQPRAKPQSNPSVAHTASLAAWW